MSMTILLSPALAGTFEWQAHLLDPLNVSVARSSENQVSCKSRVQGDLAVLFTALSPLPGM